MPHSPVQFGRAAPSVCVTDLAVALDFYGGVLGMSVTFENGQPVRFVIVESGLAEIHLHLVPNHRATATTAFHVMVDDVDALYEHVVAAGGTIIKGLRDEDFGLRAFVMADPDGNRIDVAQVP